MPRHFRHRQRFYGSNHPFSGVLWMVGLAILFATHSIWPGILILVGINILFSAIWQGTNGQQIEEREPEPVDVPMIPPPPPPAPARPAPAMPEPANQTNPELLPDTCPHCGAPVRANDVRWRGAQLAACSYCGSNLILSRPGKAPLRP